MGLEALDALRSQVAVECTVAEGLATVTLGSIASGVERIPADGDIEKQPNAADLIDILLRIKMYIKEGTIIVRLFGTLRQNR